jgi:hypothetical protein
VILPLESNVIEFIKAVVKWNKDVFGNILWKKQNLVARLRGIQCGLASAPNDFLVNLERKLILEYLSILPCFHSCEKETK